MKCPFFLSRLFGKKQSSNLSNPWRQQRCPHPSEAARSWQWPGEFQANSARSRAGLRIFPTVLGCVGGSLPPPPPPLADTHLPLIQSTGFVPSFLHCIPGPAGAPQHPRGPAEHKGSSQPPQTIPLPSSTAPGAEWGLAGHSQLIPLAIFKRHPHSCPWYPNVEQKDEPQSPCSQLSPGPTRGMCSRKGSSPVPAAVALGTEQSQHTLTIHPIHGCSIPVLIPAPFSSVPLSSTCCWRPGGGQGSPSFFCGSRECERKV